MMIKLLFVFGFALLANSAPSQPVKNVEGKFLIFKKENFQKMNIVNDFQGKINVFNSALNKQKESFQKNIKTEIDNLEKIQNSQEKAEKEAKIKQKYINFEKKFSSLRDSGEQKIQEAAVKLNNLIQASFKAVSKKHSDSIIFNDDAFAYCNSNKVLDVSDLVVEDINSKHKTIEIDFPEV